MTFNFTFSKRQIEAMLKMIDDHEQDMISALEKDLRRPKQECMVVEIDFLRNDLKNILYNIDEWVKPERVILFVFNIHI